MSTDNNNDTKIPNYRLTGYGDEFDDQGNPSDGATYRKAMKADLTSMMTSKEVFDFYGAHSRCFKLGSNGNTIVFEVLEDPSDGYRSYYHTTIVTQDPGGFFAAPIGQVRLTMQKIRGNPYYVIKDNVDGHVWVRFGTDSTGDSYYPCFVFSYYPKKGNKGPAT